MHEIDQSRYMHTPARTYLDDRITQRSRSTVEVFCRQHLLVQIRQNIARSTSLTGFGEFRGTSGRGELVNTGLEVGVSVCDAGDTGKDDWKRCSSVPCRVDMSMSYSHPAEAPPSCNTSHQQVFQARQTCNTDAHDKFRGSGQVRRRPTLRDTDDVQFRGISRL